MKDVQRLLNKISDGMEHRRWVLEELPIAPPLEHHKPTAAELVLQEDQDTRTLTLLKHRLGPNLTELKRKFKQFMKCVLVCEFSPHCHLLFLIGVTFFHCLIGRV